MQPILSVFRSIIFFVLLLHVCTGSHMSCTIMFLYLLFQDLSEEEADRPTLEVLRELVSLCVLKILYKAKAI